MRISPIVCLTALLASAASSAIAQESSAPPAHVSFVEGAATLERNGETEPVGINMPVIEGDRLRTTTGRLQIAFPDGSAVDLDPNSDVEYLGGARVRVYAGGIENRPAVVVRSQSAQYLPSDSQSYAADFDQSGTWQYDTTYGNVWYPTVAADWRPYYYGYWSSVPTYGWTWIGYNRWTWPTHHYGRWGYASSRWFWIPGRAYSSAWVSWGTAPGYVSWCPLGYDGRAVAALSVGYSRGWNAWTIVPRANFGWRGYPAHRYAVEPYRIAASTPFIVQRAQPSFGTRDAGSSVSAPRSSTMERDGFSRAVPREGVRPSEREGLSRANVREGVGRSTPRETFSRTPAAPYQRSAPTYRPPAAPSSQPSRPAYQAPSRPQVESSRPSYRPPAQSAPRQGGGGHAGGAPHADRGSSGGSHGGSHGGGSKGRR